MLNCWGNTTKGHTEQANMRQTGEPNQCLELRVSVGAYKSGGCGAYAIGTRKHGQRWAAPGNQGLEHYAVQMEPLEAYCHTWT